MTTENRRNRSKRTRKGPGAAVGAVVAAWEEGEEGTEAWAVQYAAVLAATILPLSMLGRRRLGTPDTRSRYMSR